MTKGILYSLFLFMPLFSAAQIALDRQVIGSFGNSSNLGSVVLSSTAGEAVIETISGTNILLTQGFHQAFNSVPLSFSVETTLAACATASDGSASIVNLVGCTPPYFIEWSNGDEGLVSPDLKPGLYSVRVTTVDCQVTEEFEILAGSSTDCDIIFYNAFSPNGDGQNETWEIGNVEKEEFRQNKVEIFNRWGQPIWSASNYNNSDVVFEGMHENGEPLAGGTYFYIAEIAGITYNGFIELTR